MNHASVQPVSLKSGLGEVESVYPLSPVQEGLRFHTLWDAASGVYVQQLVLRLEGADAELLGRAWQLAVEHHAVLRSSVCGEGSDGGPMLVVHPSMTLPLRMEDWRGQSDTELRGRLDAYLLFDRERGFDLAAGPLARLLIARTAEESLALVWSHHHLLLDEASLLLVLRDVFALHEALRHGGEARLEHSLAYRDYVEWLLGRDRSEAEAFWRKQLQGFSAPTPLVVDRQVAPEAPRARSGELTLGLGAELSEALRSVSARHGLRVDTFAEGAWAVLLSRYSNEQDVLFGRVMDGRGEALPGIQSMVGPCFNLLPKRVLVPAEDIVLPWLQRLEAQDKELGRHAQLPLARMKAFSQVESGKPLFETIFLSQGALHQDVARCLGAGLRLLEARMVEHTSYALTALLTDESELAIRYDAACFDEATISRMLGHWQVLLAGMARAPEQRLSALQLLTAAERQFLLVDVNEGKAFPQDKCIHERFQLQASRFPDAVAVSLGEATLTYRELEHRSNLVAHHLRGLGVAPGVLVGLFLERSFELMVGMLGILKAGGAYLPLDPTTPMERVGFILQDAQTPVVLTDSVLAVRLPASNAKVTCLDTDWSTIAQGREDCPTSGVKPGDLAYVIYTSGSTGKPKGVMVNHDHVGRLFAATDAWFHFDERDVWTFFHSSAFDFSVWEIWGALLYGGRLVLVPYLVSRSPDEFHELLVREQVTVLNQTPSAFRQLIHADQSKGTVARLALRYVIFGGEALEFESLRPWFQKYGSQKPQLINMYGITETTVHVTYRPIVERDLELRSSVIGRPIPDLQIYLLDPHGNPVPVGVPGEIHVGGAGVARGYLARPELSAQRFIPDRFSGGPEARLYRSGDLARFRDNGDIEYLGRIDHQVKIRGFRIELGEIEAALQQHPGVRENVVVVREDVPGDKRLVAYVVEKTPGALAAGELRSALQEKLPDYMVPTAFVMLDVLPLTGNGKVDRRALPTPQKSAGSSPANTAPQSDTEQMLAALWADLLGVETVGLQDDFFALGGNSLSALVLAARLQALLGVDCGVKSIFAAPTLAQLAASVMPDASTALQGTAGEAGASQGSTGSTAATLKKIWEELLQVEGIRDGDDFFALGGHSTILVEALYRIETQLGVKLVFREFFQNPTIAQLTVLIEQRSAKKEKQPQQYAFDMQVGDDVATFYLSEEDYLKDGIPEGAFNVRVVPGSN